MATCLPPARRTKRSLALLCDVRSNFTLRSGLLIAIMLFKATCRSMRSLQPSCPLLSLVRVRVRLVSCRCRIRRVSYVTWTLRSEMKWRAAKRVYAFDSRTSCAMLWQIQMAVVASLITLRFACVVSLLLYLACLRASFLSFCLCSVHFPYGVSFRFVSFLPFFSVSYCTFSSRIFLRFILIKFDPLFFVSFFRIKPSTEKSSNYAAFLFLPFSVIDNF